MLRKWSMAALCAAAALMVAAFAACSNGDGDGDGGKDLSQTTETFSVKYDVAGLADVTMKDGGKGANIQKRQGETLTEGELWNVTGIKDGYAFAGWYMDAECTVPFADFTVTKHTTLYAKFTAANGVAAIKVIRYETEKSYMDAKRTVADTLPPSYLSCPPTSVADGRYFSGWFADKGCTERAEPGDPVGAGGMTLYAEWSDLRPGASATFAGTDFDDIDGLYARSTSKDEKTGEYTYTSLSEPEKNKDYYPITGVSKIGGALVFSKTMGNVRVRSGSNGSTVAELRLDNSLNSSNVTLVESLANYVCVRPTGAGTVTATLSNVPSSSVTGMSVAKALFIDGNGKVIAQTAIDNKKGATTAPVTLSCTVTTAAPVYLAFGRYDDAGGQLGVKTITFTPDASGSGGELPVVANLPASVGTDSFEAGTYTASIGVSGSWLICFGEKMKEVGGTKIEIDTAKNSIMLLSNDKDDGHEKTNAVLKYAYDSTKKEIYLALSRLGYEKKDDDDTSYLWTKDEIVSYLQSIVGQAFEDKGELYTYTQEDFADDKAELDDGFNVVVTYGYGQSENGSITLTLKDPIIYEGYKTVTLTGMPKLVSAWQRREIDEDDGELLVETFYFYDNKTWMMVYGDEKTYYSGQAGTYEGNATSGNVTCTAYWNPPEIDLIKVTISGNTLTWSDDTFQKLPDTKTIVTVWQRTDGSGKHTVYFYSYGTYMRVCVSGDKTSVDLAGEYTGDTTKNTTIQATDWQWYQNKPSFTIDGNVLTIHNDKETSYQFTKI